MCQFQESSNWLPFIWLSISGSKRSVTPALERLVETNKSNKNNICVGPPHLSLHLHGQVLEHVMQVLDALLQLPDLVVPRFNFIQRLLCCLGIDQDLWRRSPREPCCLLQSGLWGQLVLSREICGYQRDSWTYKLLQTSEETFRGLLTETVVQFEW